MIAPRVVRRIVQAAAARCASLLAAAAPVAARAAARRASAVDRRVVGRRRAAARDARRPTISTGCGRRSHEISPALVDAFLLKEDRWFYWHPGVNPIALARAAIRTYRGGERQGGSTLTMQLARLMYRLNTRTPAGKLRQIAAALWLEARYSKRELLEAYLNVVPFGGNIQGVGAASRIYFGKPPDRVTLGEALTLAVIPQRPASRAGRGRSDAEPAGGARAARRGSGCSAIGDRRRRAPPGRAADRRRGAQFAMP